MIIEKDSNKTYGNIMHTYTYVIDLKNIFGNISCMTNEMISDFAITNFR
jgi:hypothetical protein